MILPAMVFSAEVRSCPLFSWFFSSLTVSFLSPYHFLFISLSFPPCAICKKQLHCSWTLFTHVMTQLMNWNPFSWTATHDYDLSGNKRTKWCPFTRWWFLMTIIMKILSFASLLLSLQTTGLMIVEGRSWVSHRRPSWGWCCWLGWRVPSFHRGRIFAKWVPSSSLSYPDIFIPNPLWAQSVERRRRTKRNDS